MSIRGTLLAVNAAVAAIVILLAGALLASEWSSLRSLGRATQAVKVVGGLSEATMALSLERSLTQVALALDAPIGGDIATLLNRQRERANALFADAKANLSAAEAIAGRETLQRAIDDHLGAIADLRRRADPQMAAPIADRSVRERKDIPVELKSRVSALDGLLGGVRAGLDDLPLTIRDGDRILRSAWAIREYGGRERTLFAIATARREAISPADMRYMAQNHGQVLEAWREIEAALERGAAPDDIQSAARALGARYFGAYGDLRAALFAKAGDGDYPVSFDTLFAESEAALQAAESVVSIAVQANAKKIAAALADEQLWFAAIMLAAFLAVAVVAFAVWFATARISRPVRRVTNVMGRLAAHDLQTAIPDLDRKDEVGAMTRAVAVFRDQMIDGDRLRQEQEAEEAAKEARSRAIDAAISQFGKAADEAMMGLAASADNLDEVAGDMTLAAAQTSGRSSAVAAASAEAAEHVRRIAEATGQLSGSIQDIALQATRSTEMSSQAVAFVEGTSQRVQSLSEAAAKISGFVGLIDEIAEKTNLLALNATIEAARAGEAGKGFAVVAGEVKSLASQTAKATEEIGRQVDGIQTATNEAKQAISEISDVIRGLNEISTTIAAAVEQQGAATQEIADGADRTASGAEGMLKNIAGVRDAATAAGAATSQVEDASSAVGAGAARLRGDIESFLQQIRAA